MAKAIEPSGSCRLNSTQPIPCVQRSFVTRVCRIGNLTVAVSFSARPAFCSRAMRCFFSLRLAARRSVFCCGFVGFLVFAFARVGHLWLWGGMFVIGHDAPSSGQLAATRPQVAEDLTALHCLRAAPSVRGIP